MTDQNTVKEAFSFDDLYSGRFFKASSMRGNKVTLTIADVWTEELEGERGTDRKAILSFKGTDKQLVLPKVNGVCIKGMFGANVKEWIGKRVTFWPTDTIMPFPGARGDDRYCVRVFGSPDIDKPIPVEFRPPKRRAIKMTMQPTGKAPATDSGNLSGDALRAAQGKIHAMTNACARQLGSTPDAYYAAVKQSAGIATGKEMTQAQVDLACSHLRDYIDGREPPL